MLTVFFKKKQLSQILVTILLLMIEMLKFENIKVTLCPSKSLRSLGYI
jgi:hypothetical protein